MEDASADRERWACPHAVPKCGLLDVYKAPNPSHRCGDCGFFYCGICCGDGDAFTCNVCAPGSGGNDGARAWRTDDDTEGDDADADAIGDTNPAIQDVMSLTCTLKRFIAT